MVSGVAGNRRFLEVRAAPSAPQNPSPFGMAFGAAGAAQTSNIDDFPAGSKTMYAKTKCNPCGPQGVGPCVSRFGIVVVAARWPFLNVTTHELGLAQASSGAGEVL